MKATWCRRGAWWLGVASSLRLIMLMASTTCAYRPRDCGLRRTSHFYLFLPRDAMHSATYVVRCPSVCTSVKFVYSINQYFYSQQSAEKKKWEKNIKHQNTMNVQNTTTHHFSLNDYWGWQDDIYPLYNS